MITQGATIAGETCTYWDTVAFTAVHRAARYGSSELRRQLLGRFSGPSFQRLYPNPIHLAIAHGHAERARILIEYSERGMPPCPWYLDWDLTLFLIKDTLLIKFYARQDPQS